MKRALKVLLPFVVVGIAAGAASIMVLSREAPPSREPEVAVPLIRARTVTLGDLQLTVSSQGTVRPRTETVLLPEIGGRVIEVSPDFVSGGFFEAGDVLLRLDPHDYEQGLIQARGQVAQANLRLELERAEADVARGEWEDLQEDRDPSPLTLRAPQVAGAEASLASSKAALETAKRNLERTTVRAPYRGRVRAKQVDVGQYVIPGTPLGEVYAVDFAEIRLPLPSNELAFVKLPLAYRGAGVERGPDVILRADFAGGVHEWRGRIVRTEGEIDPRTRMVTTVARVRDPYGRGTKPGRPPLAAGLYVQAEIIGEQVENVAVLPRSALRSGDQVLVIDDDERLRFRQVEVLRRTEDRVILRSGLNDGERVCISPLIAVTDGMQVRVRPETETATDGDGDGPDGVS